VANHSLVFNLKIPQSEILRYYKGNAKNILVTLKNGQRVQLPIENFRPYVSDLGLYGEFEVVFTDEFKLVSLVRLKD